MKKILVFAVCVITAGAAMAQGWDFSVSKSEDLKRNQFAIELGVGSASDINVDLGFCWRMNFSKYVAWDVLTFKALADVAYDDILDATILELLTGVRGTSPVFYKNMSAYLTAKAGYAVACQDIDGDGEFAFELGVGVNLTRHLYVGYAFNNCGVNEEEYYSKKHSYNYATKADVHSIRIGYTF